MGLPWRKVLFSSVGELKTKYIENREVRYAVNTIGAASYHLREHIKKLEMAYCQQVENEVEESKETTDFADTFQEPEKG